MTVQNINTDLIDLSIEEQEILSGGRRRAKNENTGTIKVDDAVFEFGGEEYPAQIFVKVEDLPSEEEEEDDED
ncbi:MAG: hypothetical protein EA343_02480 [Nodularia sp. (in: Bacteria)]|nr:MAG: hypothetical protein EA343_02480 [Nodularia sp. (in: cyanobacteria)]